MHIKAQLGTFLLWKPPMFFLYCALLCVEVCLVVVLVSVLCSCFQKQITTISFSFSSGSAMLTDFTVSNKRSRSIILVYSLPGEGQCRSKSSEASGDLLRIG